MTVNKSINSLEICLRNLLNFLLYRSLKNFVRQKLRDLHYISVRLKSYTNIGCNLQFPLKGYYQKTHDFCQQFGATYIPICLKEQNQNQSNSLSAEIVSQSDISCLNSPALFVTIIPKGRVLHDYGVVITPNHRLLGDVSPSLGDNIRDHAVLFESKLPPIQSIKGNLAVLSSTAHQRYFHWMFDVLPRLELLQYCQMNVDYYLINYEKDFQRESIEILDICKENIINPKYNTHLEAEKLIVPSLPGKISYMTSRSCDFLRSVFLRPEHLTCKPERALYITRSDALTRRVTNELEIIEELVKREFEVLSLEGRSILEQAKLFANAKIIVGPHGAGLTNIVFCCEQSEIIEFMPDTYSNLCFQRLAKIRNLNYRAIPGRTGSPLEKHQPNKTHDQWVDLQELIRVLND